MKKYFKPLVLLTLMCTTSLSFAQETIEDITDWKTVKTIEENGGGRKLEFQCPHFNCNSDLKLLLTDEDGDSQDFFMGDKTVLWKAIRQHEKDPRRVGFHVTEAVVKGPGEASLFLIAATGAIDVITMPVQAIASSGSTQRNRRSLDRSLSDPESFKMNHDQFEFVLKAFDEGIKNYGKE